MLGLLLEEDILIFHLFVNLGTKKDFVISVVLAFSNSVSIAPLLFRSEGGLLKHVHRFADGVPLDNHFIAFSILCCSNSVYMVLPIFWAFFRRISGSMKSLVNATSSGLLTMK